MALRFLAASLCTAAAVTLAAQDAPPVFRADTHLALVTFQVRANQSYVSGLNVADFELLEDGQPRDITFFQRAGGPAIVPVDIALLFENSSLVRDTGVVDRSRTHFDFLDERLFRGDLLADLPQATLALYVFHGQLLRVSGPTRDPETLRGGFAAVINSGPGEQLFQLPGRPDLLWLYDAIDAAIADVGRTQTAAVRMIVVVASGFSRPGDGAPRLTAAAAERAGVIITPVTLGHRARQDGYRDWSSGPADRTWTARMDAQNASYESQVKGFLSLGERTGGLSFDPPELNDETLRTILRAVADQARNTYVVGFIPVRSVAPAAHALEVRLRQQPRGTTLSGGRRVITY